MLMLVRVGHSGARVDWKIKHEAAMQAKSLSSGVKKRQSRKEKGMLRGRVQGVCFLLLASVDALEVGCELGWSKGTWLSWLANGSGATRRTSPSS